MVPKLDPTESEKFIKHQKLMNEIRQKALALIMKVDKDVGEHKLAELIKKIEGDKE